MRHRFQDRFARFRFRDQFFLGLAAGLPLVLFALLTPPSLLTFVVVILLMPVSAYAVIAIASNWQRARNTVIAVEAEERLSAARSTASTALNLSTPPRRDPEWAATFALIEKEELYVRNAGHEYFDIIPTRDGKDISGVIMRNRKFGPALSLTLEREIENLRRIRNGHPSVERVRATHEAENRIYDLVGKAVTGVDTAAMRALVPLGREFTVVGDCENGHWAVHNLGTVFTAVGGQRMVTRFCDCGSRWTETI